MATINSRLLAVGCSFLFVAAFSAGCHKPKYTLRPEGHLVADSYTNSFFGFSLEIPKNWSVLNRSEIENPPPPTPLKQERNPFNGQLFTIPDVKMYNLITLVAQTNLFPDATITAMSATNLALSVLAQNVSYQPAVRSGKDYLNMIRGIFEIVATPSGAVQFAGPSEVLVGGQKFYRDTFRTRRKNNETLCRIYARLDRGFGFIFVLSAPTEAELDQLEPLMATVRFN